MYPKNSTTVYLWENYNPGNWIESVWGRKSKSMGIVSLKWKAVSLKPGRQTFGYSCSHFGLLFIGGVGQHPGRSVKLKKLKA